MVVHQENMFIINPVDQRTAGLQWITINILLHGYKGKINVH